MDIAKTKNPLKVDHVLKREFAAPHAEFEQVIVEAAGPIRAN
ncbi:MAG: hypothetical protein V3T19_02340 [Acidiferrobacterales bacterium]|jgi:hypothetical protein